METPIAANLHVFSYEGRDVTFNLGNGDVMVNATEMAKVFGKRPIDWLRLPNTETFLNELQAVRKSHRLIETVNGVGTWMHEDVALEFARWLSPKFAIWCNDQIKMLLKHGNVSLGLNEDEMIAKSMAILAQRVEQQKMQLELARSTIQEQAPKVEYHDSVLQSSGLIATNVIAKELGMSAVKLNKELHRRGIIYRCDGVWVLYSKYQGQGYTKTKTTHYKDSLGRDCTSILTYWTEKGRKFIHDLFKCNMTSK